MRKFVVIPGNNPGVIKRAVAKRGNWDDITEEKGDGDVGITQFIWKPTNLSIRAYALMDSSPLHPDYIQIINHFENNRGICTKTGLIRSLRSYYYHNEQANLHRYTLFESTPTTFLITAGDENQEYVNFVARFRDIAKKQFTKEHIPEKHCHENLWLIKPANMNQGRGIEIFKNLKDIQAFFNTQAANSFWVAQKYIEKPLCYYGRKFDIRVWVIVTAKMEIFFYRTPYMRTSSNEYVTDAFDNYIHLTNNCLQKHGDNFGRFEAGNTLPLSALQEYIDETFPQHGVSVEKQLIPRMKDLIIDTIMSIKKSMNPKRRKNCFELFGYDFLIDEDYRTWLLEVNTNPYLGVPNDFIKTMLPEMVDDMLKIVLDPFYPPSNPDAISDNENKFDLIYCEHHSAYHQGPMNMRSKFSENIYPVPSIAPPLRHVRAPAQDRTPKEVQDTYASNASIKAQADKEFLEKCKVELANTEFPGFGLVKVTKTQKKPQTMIAVEPINTQEGITSTTPSGTRTGEKRKSATATVTTTSQTVQQGHHHVNHNGLTETARKIDDLLESYTLCDQEHFMPLISKLLSVLVNWELQSDKELSTACKSVLTLSESRMCGALTEPNNIIQMIDLLNSQDVPLKIQVTTVTAFLSICKKISEMKKIICDKMIHALVKIVLASCDSTLIQNYDIQVIKLSIKCLSALAGKYDRKMYIPGETRDFDKVREFLISQGGITGLMIVSKLSVDEEIQEMPSRSCFSYLGISDWELQKSVLERANAYKDSTEETEAPGSAIHNPKAKQTRGFLFAGSQSLVLSKYDSTSKNNKTIVESNSQPPINDKTPNIPKNLLERSDYPIDSMIADVEEKISKLKEQKKKREQEEEEKREQTILDQIKEQKEKELLMNEKRKKAEEVFLKRLEEKKRFQEEVAKRTEEESKQRFVQEEERKKTKIQELLRKKEEYDKKTKKFELKRKKLEDEMKKMVDEELEKKKLQRKALEESFWSRIKAKQKEKQLDKITTKTEETKRTSSLAISHIELSSSVDPRSQDDSSDKTRMMRTHHFNTPQHGIEDGKAVTFSSFFKEDAPMDLRMGRHSYKTSMSQEPRQRSVEDTRSRKSKEECISLPCIDGSSRTIKSVNEKIPKALRQSNLFTLNEAIEEEANNFNDELARSDQGGRKLLRQFNPLRTEAEKLKKITSSENMKPNKNTAGIKEVLVERYKDKEKEKEKVRDLIKQSPYGQLLRQASPQDLDNFNTNGTFKVYVQGARRKFKLQQNVVKN